MAAAPHRLLLALAALAAASVLGGCGFTPLYARPGVTGALSTIQVDIPRGQASEGASMIVNRIGFLLNEDLEDELATNRQLKPNYRLDVTLDERNYQRGLTVNDVNTRNETHVWVRYSLVDLASGKVLKTGMEPVEVSYAAANDPYAGVTAQQDAQERAASTAADWLRVDLAAYFAGRDPQ